MLYSQPEPVKETRGLELDVRRIWPGVHLHLGLHLSLPYSVPRRLEA